MAELKARLLPSAPTIRCLHAVRSTNPAALRILPRRDARFIQFPARAALGPRACGAMVRLRGSELLAHALRSVEAAGPGLLRRVPRRSSADRGVDRPQWIVACRALPQCGGRSLRLALRRVSPDAQRVLVWHFGQRAFSRRVERRGALRDCPLWLRERGPARGAVGALHVLRPRGAALVFVRVGDSAFGDGLPCDLPVPAARRTAVPAARAAGTAVRRAAG